VTALIIANAILWVLVVILAVVVLALVRQVGVLHERIAPAGALMISKGLKIGELAPALAVTDLDERPVTVGGARADGLSTLLMFVSPTCPVCKTLLPVLTASRRSERSWLQVLLASDGEVAIQRAFVAEHGLEAFPYIVSASLGMTYQVSRLPFAVLVDADGILRARGLINSREHLESLFEAKRLGVASLQDFMEAAAQRPG
jgi:methylamine dehydrogenase accessory protein MauD